MKDVPGLGLSGSQAEVAPGYMRNYLKPRSLAFYVPRATRHVSPASAAAESVTPTPVLLQPKPELLQLNIAQLAERIASLPTIVLQRRLQTSSDPVESSTESTGTTASGGQLIFGSVTPLDVQKAIEEEHQFLVSNASISFLSGESKLRHTGIATAEVAFRNGSIVFITVDVQGTS
ncbi:hypothetical protein DL93DRAFT_2161895 [Clavulina sp. PMI_390]|nr:hypothetical protein DL93DRAFT_2161895 [Clavulina sp. PMI_390]